jgi:hypothetical protein
MVGCANWLLLDGCMPLLERLMVWRVSRIDPKTDATAAAVLTAFESARRAGLTSVECYRAGVAAWRQAHPDQAPEYAAKQAVAVILATHAKIRVAE